MSAAPHAIRSSVAVGVRGAGRAPQVADRRSQPFRRAVRTTANVQPAAKTPHATTDSHGHQPPETRAKTSHTAVRAQYIQTTRRLRRVTGLESESSFQNSRSTLVGALESPSTCVSCPRIGRLYRGEALTVDRTFGDGVGWRPVLGEPQGGRTSVRSAIASGHPAATPSLSRVDGGDALSPEWAPPPLRVRDRNYRCASRPWLCLVSSHRQVLGRLQAVVPPPHDGPQCSRCGVSDRRRRGLGPRGGEWQADVHRVARRGSPVPGSLRSAAGRRHAPHRSGAGCRGGGQGRSLPAGVHLVDDADWGGWSPGSSSASPSRDPNGQCVGE